MAKLFAFGALWLCLVVTVICPRHCVSVRSDQEIRDRFYGNLLNGTAPDSGDGSIAKMFDRVLEKEFSEKEFSENDQPEGKAFASLFFYCELLVCSGVRCDFLLKIALLTNKNSIYRKVYAN